MKGGTPTGLRSRVSRLKVCYPNQLDDRGTKRFDNSAATEGYTV